MITNENLTLKEALEKHGKNLSVGDEVYYMLHKHDHIDCETCEGNGTVNVFLNDDEYTVDCPVCGGDGYKTYRHYSVNKGEITSIGIILGDFRKHKYWGDYKTPIEIRVSGLLSDVSEFFLTSEECQAKVDELNKKELENAIHN